MSRKIGIASYGVTWNRGERLGSRAYTTPSIGLVKGTQREKIGSSMHIALHTIGIDRATRRLFGDRSPPRHGPAEIG